jgi:hypothetical protein
LEFLVSGFGKIRFVKIDKQKPAEFWFSAGFSFFIWER